MKTGPISCVSAPGFKSCTFVNEVRLKMKKEKMKDSVD